MFHCTCSVVYCWGTCVLPGQLIYHWSSSRDPSSGLHAAATPPQTMALTGPLNQVRGGNSFQMLSKPGICISQHAKFFLTDWAEMTTWIQWPQRWQSKVLWSAQSFVRHQRGQGYPLDTDLSSSVSILPYYWTRGSLGERVRLQSATLHHFKLSFGTHHDFSYLTSSFSSPVAVGMWQVQTHWQS